MYIERCLNNPYHLEDLNLSLITFGNDQAQAVSPLVEPNKFDRSCLSVLEASGNRVLGSGLRLLGNRAKYEIWQRNQESKGD